MKTKLVSLFLILFFLAFSAFAQTTPVPSRNMDKEKLLWQELEKLTPGQVEAFKQATEALDANDYETAVKLYTQVAENSPKFDAAMRRLGFAYAALGKRKEALTWLEKAAKENSSSTNLSSLAQVLGFSTDKYKPSKEESERALKLAKTACEKDQEANIYDFENLGVVAEIAIDLERQEEICQASTKLSEKYPDLMQTHYYSYVCAAYQKDWIKAEEEIKKAESLGLSKELTNKILASGISSEASFWRYTFYALYLTIAWVFGLVALFILGKIFSNLTLKAIKSHDPNLTNPLANNLRKHYRNLINFACFYYYLSMPMVVFLVIAIAGSIIYGFVMMGRIPIKLALIIGVGAIMTVVAVVRSFFIKVDSSDPGRSLKEEEAPGLWQLTREVAQAVGTRPIDEIRITPETDMAVYEKGSWREKSQDSARRVLILGVALLNDFDQNAFRAVLAHEYGHFSNRDTAGGDIALRVHNDMIKFVLAIALSGQAVWWNLGYQFLRVYDFIFRRISHGATRLQEVMADQISAMKYGGQAFEEGLRHVIQREVEFSHFANKEIDEAISTHRAISNLYKLEIKPETNLTDKINEIITTPTSEDDTHPCPMDRFIFVNQIKTLSQLQTNGMVWDLFTDKEELTKEMSLLIAKSVARSEVNIPI